MNIQRLSQSGRAKRTVVAAALAMTSVLALPCEALAATSLNVTINGNGGLVADNRASDTLLDTISWDSVPYGQKLPVSGRGTWTRLAGFRGTNAAGTSIIAAAPGAELSYALGKLEYGLGSYTVSQLTTISKGISKNGSNSQYWQEFSDYASQGAIKEFTLSNGDVLRMRLVGLNHDKLSSSTTGYGSYAGLTFISANTLSIAWAMNATNINEGGWAESQLRVNMNPKTINGTSADGAIWKLLPSDLQSAILTVNKESTEGGGSLELTSSKNKLWAPSAAELNYGTPASASVAEGSVYTYWENKGNSERKELDVTYSGAALEKNGTLPLGGFIASWMRSPSVRGSSFVGVGTGGALFSGNDAKNGHGVIVGFCL